MQTKRFDNMTEAEQREFWARFERLDPNPGAEAARERLAAGQPIYYREGDTPAGQVIKEYPDGHRELVAFEHGKERRLADLAAA